MARSMPLKAEALDEAARLIEGGGILAMPTESSYGLGASPWQAAAIDRLYRIKGRDERSPILVLIAGPAHLPELVAEVPPAAATLMQAFWPGPLTLIFRAASRVPANLTAGTGTIGIRFPALPQLTDLLTRTGPLTGTSANRSGAVPARTAAEVQAALGAEVDLILDGGAAGGAVPSTIVDTTGPPRLIREGPIARAQIAQALAGSNLDLAL